jgi:hypothetical protein
MARKDIPASHKICVVGFADGHRDMAPWDDPDMEFWGLNRLHQVMPDRKFDRWFDVHSLQKYYIANNDAEHAKFLKDFAGPVYLRPDDMGLMDVPNAVPFPIGQVLGMFPDYFTNSVSWMLALAIIELADAADAFAVDPIGNPQPELHVYGVDMAQDSLLQAEYCVAGDTRVLTHDLRWVPAESVQPGDELVAFDEETPDNQATRYWKKAVVESSHVVYQPAYRFTMSDGTKLVSSADHRWLSGNQSAHKWSKTKNMQAPHDNPDRQSSIVKLVDTWDEDRSWGAGYLAAAVDGEGHWSQTKRGSGQGGFANRLGFGQRNNGMADEFLEMSEARGFGWNTSGDDVVNYTLSGGRSKMMRFLGAIRPRRLLGKFDADKLGALHASDHVKIIDKEYLGEVPLIALKTDAGTFVAEGFASHNSEQRPSCEYFLGHAAAMGIQVFIPDGSDLLTASHRYGFDDSDPIRGKLVSRHRELGGRKAQIQGQLKAGDEQRAQLVAGVNQLDGAMQEIQYQMRNLMPAPEADVPTLPAPPEITMETIAGGLAHVQQQLDQMAAEPPKKADN